MFKSMLYLLLSLLLTRNRPEINTEEIVDEYDFVIVGGGTSGSVIAGRLSEIPNVRILVLEAGGSDNGIPGVSLPQYWPKLAGSPVDWNYTSKSQKEYEDKDIEQINHVSRGKVLGGTSSINAMVYIRGSPHDYDSWEDHGATGWGWKDVEPYFRKVEGATEPDMSDNLGRDGPLKLTRSYSPPLQKMLLETASQLGYEKTDYTDNIEGISSIVTSIDKGIRQNAATAYLYSVLPGRIERLHILLHAHATKIVMKESANRIPKAVGVHYMKEGKLRFVKARKEVIVCAGYIGTPHLLMLSGIGPKEHLDEMKITMTVGLPGVGANFQDHYKFDGFFHTTNMTKSYVFNPEMMEDRLEEYLVNGTGPWASSLGITALLHFLTGRDEISSSTSLRPFPDVQVMFNLAANETVGFAPNQNPEDFKSVSFVIVVVLAHPKSTGSITLKSSDPQEHPLIEPNFLSNEDDLEMLIEGIRHLEKFETSELFERIKAQMIFPSDCKKYHEANVPRNKTLYECLLRTSDLSFKHGCCSAKMGSAEDKEAVVDSRLKVYGVKRLRIADASVMPHITSGNTQYPCYMIGEKAADMIKEDWKL